MKIYLPYLETISFCHLSGYNPHEFFRPSSYVFLIAILGGNPVMHKPTDTKTNNRKKRIIKYVLWQLNSEMHEEKKP
jgi:hypothetical protein